MDLRIERKAFIFVKLHVRLKVYMYMVCTYLIVMIKGHWKLATEKLPVFADFLLSFSPLSKQGTGHSRDT